MRITSINLALLLNNTFHAVMQKWTSQYLKIHLEKGIGQLNTPD